MISVIIPVYNTARYLEKCLESVVNQTYASLEILLVDDGSTDQSSQICDDYAEKDARIRVWHRKNEGVSASRNFALKNSIGDWISFVDSDDWLDENMFQHMIDLSQKTHARTVCCGAYICDDKGRIYKKANEWAFISDDNYVWDKEMALAKIMAHSATLWNKLLDGETARQIIFDTDIKYGEDMVFLAEYLRRETGSTAVMKSPCYYYRQFRNDNVVSSNLNEKYLDFIAATQKIFDILHEYNEDCVGIQRVIDVELRVLGRIPILKHSKYKEYLYEARKLSIYTKENETTIFSDGINIKLIIKFVILPLVRHSELLAVMYARLWQGVRKVKE